MKCLGEEFEPLHDTELFLFLLLLLADDEKLLLLLLIIISEHEDFTFTRNDSIDDDTRRRRIVTIITRVEETTVQSTHAAEHTAEMSRDRVGFDTTAEQLEQVVIADKVEAREERALRLEVGDESTFDGTELVHHVVELLGRKAVGADEGQPEDVFFLIT